MLLEIPLIDPRFSAVRRSVLSQLHKFSHINHILQHLTVKCKTINCVSQIKVTPVPALRVFSAPVRLIRMKASLSGLIASWTFTSGGTGSGDWISTNFLLCDSYRALCLVSQCLKLSSLLQRLHEIHILFSVNTSLEIPNFWPLGLNPKWRCFLAQFAAKIGINLRPRSIS